MDNLYEWIHDDITWCGNECSYTECERNIANRLTKGGYYSAALFRGTETCPLYCKEIICCESCAYYNNIGCLEGTGICELNHQPKMDREFCEHGKGLTILS